MEMAYFYGPPGDSDAEVYLYMCAETTYQTLYIDLAADCCWHVFTSDSYTFYLFVIYFFLR